MNFVNSALEMFEVPRSWFESNGFTDKWVMAVSLVAYILLIIIVGVILDTVTHAAGMIVELSAKRIAKSAPVRDIVRLESSSYRVTAVLHWVRMRIPFLVNQPRSDNTFNWDTLAPLSISRIVKYIVRKTWFFLDELIRVPGSILRNAVTPIGLVVLISAWFTAYPEAVRNVAQLTDSFIRNFNIETDSLLFTATVGATGITLAILVAKVFTGDKAIARRGFRRSLNESSLQSLYSIRTEFMQLLIFIAERTEYVARSYEHEQYLAQNWYEWATSSTPEKLHRWRSYDEHTECQKSCLDYSNQHRQSASPNVPSELASKLSRTWNNHINGYQRDISRFLSGHVRRSFLNVCKYFAEDGEFAPYTIPHENYLTTKRIIWQHRHLSFAKLSGEDIAAKRTVAVKKVIDPSRAWLETDLVDAIWDLAQLRRDIETLLLYMGRISRSRMIDNLNKAWE